MDCMNKNDYDREACSDVFQAYRDCKKAWVRTFPHVIYFLLYSCLYAANPITGGPTEWKSVTVLLPSPLPALIYKLHLILKLGNTIGLMPPRW
jgi:hypothetical protein